MMLGARCIAKRQDEWTGKDWGALHPPNDQESSKESEKNITVLGFAILTLGNGGMLRTIIVSTPDFGLLGPIRTPLHIEAFGKDQAHKNTAGAEGNGHYHEIHTLVSVYRIIQLLDNKLTYADLDG